MCTICACSQSLSALELVGQDLRASRRQAEAVRPRLQAGAGFSLCTRLASHTGRPHAEADRAAPAHPPVAQVGHEFVEALLRLAMLRYKKVRAQ